MEGDPIVIADAADIPHIARIYREVFPDDIPSRLGIKACERHLREITSRPGVWLWVKRSNGSPIAFAMLRLDLTSTKGSNRQLLSWREVPMLLWNLPFFLGIYGRGLRTKTPLTKASGSWQTAEWEAAQSGECPYLFKLGVSRPYRKRGIGRELMKTRIEFARGLGASQIALTVDADNQRAIDLFEDVGFRRVAFGAESNSYGYLLDL
ncbi:MAG TPA: GNAT family N-acetyltransferase [Thermoleophilia bacterium]|nr:GNAT family N-acetyltransferase [Thermoleophilia bacterium]